MKRILVTGTHRSGTTWVGKMLSLADDVSYVHEPFNIVKSRERFALPLDWWFSYFPDVADKEAFHRSYERILSLRSYPQYPKSFAFRLAARRKIRDRIQGLISRHKSNAILIKDPIALLSAEHLESTYDMQVVCMIRHPLAFCSSIKKWNWKFPFSHFCAQPMLVEERLSNYSARIAKFAEIEELGKHQDIVDQAILLWNIFHAVISSYREQHPTWIFLRHEDVVADPLEAFSSVYRRLDLSLTNEVLERITDSLNSKEGETGDASYKARDKESVLSTWKERLSPQEGDKIMEETAVLRREFYPEDN